MFRADLVITYVVYDDVASIFVSNNNVICKRSMSRIQTLREGKLSVPLLHCFQPKIPLRVESAFRYFLLDSNVQIIIQIVL